MKNLPFAILLSTLICLSHAYGQLPETPPEGKIYHYKDEGGKRSEIEIHFPAGHNVSKSRVPGIIMFHGGGWKRGDRKQFRFLCHYFAQRGLVAATAHYELANRAALKKGAFPSPKRVCIRDAKSAIRWFKQNADELGIDPERIIGGGGSAGAHIVLLATLNPGLNHPDDPRNIDTSVQAYLLFNPALKTSQDRKDAEVYLEAHLKRDIPPMVVFWGTNDNWLKGWKNAYEAMEALGASSSVEWWTAVGEGHAFFNNEPWKSLTLIQADRFLVKHGLLDGLPILSTDAFDQVLLKGPQPRVKN